MEKCPLPLFCVPKLSVKLLLQLFRLACGEVSLDSPSRFEDTRIAVMNDPSLPFTVSTWAHDAILFLHLLHLELVSIYWQAP